MFDSKEFLAHLTSRPGVYRMIDSQGATLYVGKAKNLKNRVSSYFREQDSARLQSLVSQISNIEVTITHNEKEALLLEQEYIKQQKPRYNIVLKDDKAYPYLFMSDGAYPRFVYHRGPQKAKGQYFGPYPSAFAVKETLNLLQKLFLLRQCDEVFFKNRSRPCLQYQIKRCSAPCVKYISEEHYQKDVQHALMFLKAEHREILKDLVDLMEDASHNLDYEKAAKYRDEIQNIQKIVEQQAVYTQDGEVDVWALAESGEQIVVFILFIRSGKVSGSKTLYPKRSKYLNSSEILSSLVCQYYLNQGVHFSVPQEICSYVPIESDLLLEEALFEKFQKKIRISSQVKTQRRRWQLLAQENANATLHRALNSKNVFWRRFQILAEVLGMSSLTRMECFDISHTFGEATVGSCVVFDDKGPRKDMYRSYHIEEGGGDDYAAMGQVLLRRYQKMKAEQDELPSLIVIDGGKGQLGVARDALKECQILDVTLIAVAKGEGRKPGLETIFVAQNDNGEEVGVVSLGPTHEALHLIQQIRDEAHRFALKMHIKKRAKARQSSPLESIPGVGPKRRQALLTTFGGLKALMGASEEALSKVPGVSRVLAKVIYEYLHES